MSYVVNKTNGNIVAVVEDGTIDSTSTSLSLVGKGVQNYGEHVAENLVKIVENFANATAPPNPMVGQLWFSTSDNILRVYNGLVWTNPVTASFYSTLVDSEGIGSITINNNNGISVGGASKLQLCQDPTDLKLKLLAKTGATVGTIFDIDPVNYDVKVVGTPRTPNSIATKAYVDAKSTIEKDSTNVTVTSTGIFMEVNGSLVAEAGPAGLTFSGLVYGETPPATANGSEVVTAAYVQAQKNSPEFTGFPTAPTPFTTDNSTRLATTAFVQNIKISPGFTGTPTAPTAPFGTSSTQLATTEFVQNAFLQVDLSPYAPKTNPVFFGIPRSPTPDISSSDTQIATTEFVKSALLQVDLSPYAPKINAALGGVPTVPTPPVNNNTTQIANTSFVNSLLTDRLQAYAPKTSPDLVGTPTSPTPASTDNSNRIATTAFVKTITSSVTSYLITSGFGSNTEFDVFPPSGKSMSSLVAFIPSIRMIHFNGTVDRNDTMACYHSVLSDRIRVTVYNSEQRSAPSANWLAVWS